MKAPERSAPWPVDGGEMGERIRRHKWAETPLGPVEAWPQSLRTVVDLMLGTRQPAYIAWGPALTSLYNDGYIPILGTKQPDALGRPYQELWAEVWDEYRPIVEATMAGEAQHFVDRPVALAGRAGLPISWFTFSWTPLRHETGAVAGFYCVALETTEKVRVEENLRAGQEAARRESEERFRLMADAVPQIIWITDAAGRVEFFNRQWTLYTGAPCEPVTAAEIASDFIHPDDAAATVAAFEAARNAGSVFQVEHRIRSAAGEYRWFLVRAEPYRDARTGQIARWFGASMDIHDRKLAEEARQASERHAKLLLAELQHRVRNTLSVVRSIARRTAATSDTVEEYAAHLDGRIDAFARVQAAVTRNPIAGLDLEQLVADEFLAHAAHEGEQVESIAGPKLLLKPKAAEGIGLAIHELATNAVKYGALSSKRGRVSVRWRIEDAGTEPRLVIEWIETGMKLSGDGPRRRGFGTELIERILAYEIGGEAGFAFEPQGLRCTISLPVDDHLLVEDERGGAQRP